MDTAHWRSLSCLVVELNMPAENQVPQDWLDAAKLISLSMLLKGMRTSPISSFQVLPFPLSGQIISPYTLHLQIQKEALHYGIVPTVSLTAHAAGMSY